jgi:hypothetical protein
MVGTAVMAFSYCYLYAAQWGRNEMDAEMPRQMRAARLGPRGTLLCDVCDKPHKTLGRYTRSGQWAVCGRCFAKADAIAARKDHWPTDDDFARLRNR